MSLIRVVSDSSFFICFLDEINRVDILIQLITHEDYKFTIGQIILLEVTAKECPEVFLSLLDSHVDKFEYYNYGEILRPFFSVDEIDRGETEAIVISFVLHSFDHDHWLIIDERPGRTFLEKTFPQLFPHLIGTIGFIVRSTLERNIFTEDDAIALLGEIRKSSFRVDPAIVQKAIDSLKGA